MNSFISRIKNYDVLLISALFFLAAFLIYFYTQPSEANPFKYFNYLADAFLHGRLHVEITPSYFEELVEWNGKYYVIYPPMPAVLLMPFVAFWGTEFNHVLASVVLGSLNVSIVYIVMRKLTRNLSLQIWMTVLFGFGTIYWYTVTIGSVWYFAHITSLFFLLLAIYATLSGRNALLIGLLLGASYWSRLTTILTFPFFIIMLSAVLYPRGSTEPILKRINIKSIVLFGIGVSAFVLLNFLYNYMRFGSPLDVAYSLHSISPAKESVSPWFDKGLLSISYIRYHVYAFLLQPPVFIDRWPYVIPSMAGLSILITTPAFMFALLAGIKNRLALACWSAILLVVIVVFLKSGTGWTQFGYRYALDFYPFLLILTLKGIGDSLKWYHKLLIVLSVLVNIWGVLFINIFGWYKLY
jgi:hypothetical protein